MDLISGTESALVVVARPSLRDHKQYPSHGKLCPGKGHSSLGVIINFSRPPESTVARKYQPLLLEKLCCSCDRDFPHLNNLEDEVLERNALNHLDIRSYGSISRVLKARAEKGSPPLQILTHSSGVVTLLTMPKDYKDTLNLPLTAFP